MASQEPKPNTKPTDSLGLDAINELLGKPHKLWWLNFKTGLIRGFSSVVGAALAIVIIGFLVTLLGGLPVIGNIIHSIGDAARAK